jgi:hypothetical protein
VVLNESWARKTMQLTESEEACKQKGRELEAAYKQKEKELDEAYKRKADGLETCIAEKEGELNSQIEKVSKQFSTLETATVEQVAKKVEVEKQLVGKNEKIEEPAREGKEKGDAASTQFSGLEAIIADQAAKAAEIEKRYVEKSKEVEELEKKEKERTETLRTMLSKLETATLKHLFEKDTKIQELEKSKAEVEDKLAEKDARISELQALKDCQEGEAHALRASIDAHRMTVANGEGVDEGLKSPRAAINDYQTSIRRILARADRLEEERVEGAAQVQEEFGEISEQHALFARRVEEFNQHVRATNQRTLEPDRRGREIYKELDVQAGLGGKRVREYLADEEPVSKRHQSRASSQSSFASLGSAVGGSVEGVENVYKHGIDLYEEEVEERAEREAEESILVALQANDREPSDAEEDDSVAGEDQEPGELRKRIDTSFAEMCGSVGFPEGWSLRRRVAFFDGLFEKEEEIHQKAAGSKKKGKRPIGEFGPTTTSWVELFDKGVKGTPQTHGGGSRICFMALNGRLRAKFPVQVVDGSEVPENRRVLCTTHKDSTLGDGQECVFVECASGKNLESDWRGGVKWMVKEHPH